MAEVRRFAELAPVPWRNGRGVTREVVAEPASVAAWDWRLSLAEVAGDDDFSRFPGVERSILVVRGDGMVLTVDGVEHLLAAPFEPFVFDGGARTTCRLLGGALRDLNLMVRRAAVRGSLAVERVDAGGSLALAGVRAALVLDGALAEPALGACDALLLMPGEAAVVSAAEAGAVVATIRIG